MSYQSRACCTSNSNIPGLSFILTFQEDSWQCLSMSIFICDYYIHTYLHLYMYLLL